MRRSSGSSAASNAREKQYVQHNYHDHYHDPIHNETALPFGKGAPKRRKGHRGGVAVPFPEKLHFMLGCIDSEGLADIVRWQPHGRCFMVHQPKEFLAKVMPKYFRQSKLTSFQRQLNLYGFSRLTTGPDRGGYYHELFVRGRMDLCKRMIRTRVKGNGCKAASSPATEPNFYKMEPCLDTDISKQVDVSRYFDDLNIITSSDQSPQSDSATMPAMEEPPIVVSSSFPDISMASVDSNGYAAAAGAKSYPDDHQTHHRSHHHSRHQHHDVVSASDESASHPDKTLRRRSESCGSSIVPMKCPSLPVVSPNNAARICTSRFELAKGDLAGLSIPVEISFPDFPTTTAGATFYEDEEGIHSGDKIFFEGLPFHYIETKDVENGLVVVDN